MLDTTSIQNLFQGLLDYLRDAFNIDVDTSEGSLLANLWTIIQGLVSSIVNKDV
ncbi:MAG: hypothetical protein LBQ80_03055 [Clostridium sp.]|jgi:hypothetical protein|nr:hypothetical protein [Clostridium sp.]